jgi:hypothetical protein
MEVSGKLDAPAALPPESTPVAIEKEAWWASEPVWTFWGFEPIER